MLEFYLYTVLIYMAITLIVTLYDIFVNKEKIDIGGVLISLILSCIPIAGTIWLLIYVVLVFEE